MTVPGSNLLAAALGVIQPQKPKLAAFTGITTNAAGYDVPTWAAPVDIDGSLQPADNKLLQQLGLEWTKNYVVFYSSHDFGEIDRDKTGDRLIYAGKTYQVESKVPWFAQDGWSAVLCVEVTNA